MRRLNLSVAVLLFSLLNISTAFAAPAANFKDTTATKITVDNIEVDGNSISSVNTNGDINLNPNGTGKTKFPDLTASRLALIDSSGALVSSGISETTSTYLDPSSSVQTQLNTKATLASANTFTDNQVIDNAKEVRFSETDANGSHYIAVGAPDSVTATIKLTLPDSNGDPGDVVTTDGSGALSFISPTATSMPPGTVIQSAAINAPTGFLDSYAQAISRTTYAVLFAAITIQQSGTTTNSSATVTFSDTSKMVAGMPICGTGIQAATTIASVDSGTQVTLSQNANASGTVTLTVAPYGCGDGSTTFNTPDCRGRVLAGRDNIGGAAASRLTSTVMTATGGGNRIGNAAGTQTHQLTSSEMPSHTHSDSHYHLGAYNSGSTIGNGRYGSTNVGSNFTWAEAGGAMSTTNAAHTSDRVGSISSTGGDGAHLNTQPTLLVNCYVKI